MYIRPAVPLPKQAEARDDRKQRRRRKLSDKILQENITEKEKKILETIRNLDYGEVRVVVTGGVPTRIEEIKKSIKL